MLWPPELRRRSSSRPAGSDVISTPLSRSLFVIASTEANTAAPSGLVTTGPDRPGPKGSTAGAAAGVAATAGSADRDGFPRAHFREQVWGDLVDDGVCGLFIAEKLGVSQPTASEHLRILVQAELLIATRIKQWTFYRRDEARIAEMKQAVTQEI